MGEEKMSLYSSMTLSTCFCCVERPVVEAMDVAATFPLTLSMNHEEDKLPSLRDDLPALLGRDQGNGGRWDYLWYPV
jgi:hypothetical protein